MHWCYTGQTAALTVGAYEMGFGGFVWLTAVRTGVALMCRLSWTLTFASTDMVEGQVSTPDIGQVSEASSTRWC